MKMGKSSNISDTIHGTIFMTEFEKRIISTSLFNRLHSIYQNSTVYLTFPSNRTKRFEHSFGTMELCGNIFFHSISNAKQQDLEKFFKIAKIRIKKILKEIENTIERGAQYQHKLGDRFRGLKKSYDEINITGGIYNNMSPCNVSNENHTCFCTLLESVRIAALLHDVGHPPYSHVIEDALGTLFSKLCAQPDRDTLTDRQTEFLDILKRFYPAGKRGRNLHEAISMDISGQLLDASISDISNDEAKNPDIYQQNIFEIVIKEIVISIFKEESDFFKNLHSIIDGPLDGDRLDYVARDIKNAGLETARIEYKRIIPTMKLLFFEDTDDFFFCPNTKILHSIEDFFDKRWSLYKNIIFHHRVVKTDFLLKSCVEDIADDYLKSKAPDLSEETSDNSLPSSIAGLWLALKEGPSALERSYSMVQWDDAWLMAILKKHYFSEYIGRDSVTDKKLSELLTNKKYYFSIIKEIGQFVVLDNSFAKEVSVHRKEVESLIRKLKKTSQDHSSASLPENTERLDIDTCLTAIQNILRRSQEITDNAKDNSTTLATGFLLSEINLELYSTTEFMGPSFRDFVTQSFDNIKQEYKSRIEDILIVIKKATIGTDKRLYCYSDIGEDTKLRIFREISNIHSKLKLEAKLFPPFFIYILHKRSFDTKEIYFDDFLTEYGKVIGESFVSGLKEAIRRLRDEWGQQKTLSETSGSERSLF